MEVVRRNRRAYQVRECAEPSRGIKLAEVEIDRTGPEEEATGATGALISTLPSKPF